MHEITEKKFRISKTDITFEKIYSKDYFPNSVPGIREANMLLIPNENLRDNTGFTFPETTDEFYEFLQERANADFKPEIAISDEDFRKFCMHSAEVTLATMVCTLFIAPIVTNLISAYLSYLALRYLRKEDELSAEINLIIQDENGRSIKFNYRGPVSGVKETLNNGIVKAYGDVFSLKVCGQEICLKNVASFKRNSRVLGEKEDDVSDDTIGN